MPRRLPQLARRFSHKVDDALLIAETGEIAKLEAYRGSRTRQLLHVPRLEGLYELAFLKVFVSWEAFLEDTFLRLLCGYTSVASGQEPLQPGRTYETNLASAESAVLGNRAYVLWHNPVHVISRCQRFFLNGNLEMVVASNTARLEALANVRHRIVHSQADALAKFDGATMLFAAKRYRGSRVGQFLRDWENVSNTLPQRRWLSDLSAELKGLARQIA